MNEIAPVTVSMTNVAESAPLKAYVSGSTEPVLGVKCPTVPTRTVFSGRLKVTVEVSKSGPWLVTLTVSGSVTVSTVSFAYTVIE